MYYVYVLQSKKDNSLYIGYTSNLKKRFKQHNSGQSIYTAKLKPYKLVFYIAFPTKKDAKRYEEYLKSGYGRRTLNKMLKEYFASNYL